MAVDQILRTNQNNPNPTHFQNYVIFTDSRSVFDSMNNTNDHPTIRYIIHKLHVARAQGIQVEICWIPSHLGIQGNERADLKAKEASRRTPELIPIHYKDFYPIIQQKMKAIREQIWSQSPNKLRTIKEDLKAWPHQDLSRREEVVLNRLRIGHTNLTHCHLMDSAMMNGPPICFACNDHILTIDHIFTQCPSLQPLRNQLFPPPRTLESMLGTKCNTSSVLEFVKKCNIFSHI